MIGTAQADDCFRLVCEADRLWCAAEARRFAGRLGFGDRAQWEVAVVVAELVSNAVGHAGSGTLQLGRAGGPRPGIQIVVTDHGPGMDPDLPPPSPAWHRPGLGLGLRTVRELMHAVEIASERGRGTTVTALRFLEP